MYYTVGVFLIMIMLVLQSPVNCLFRSLTDKDKRQNEEKKEHKHKKCRKAVGKIKGCR